MPSSSTNLTGNEYRSIVEHSPVLIWRSSTDALCDYFNEPWLQFTGRTMEQECGNGWAEGVHPEDLQRCVDHYLEHFKRRAAFEMEYRLRRHDGVYRWVLDRGTPNVDENGVFRGFIGSCIDVDDRRRMQIEREQRDERALAMAHEFEQWLLAIVSHDIRNPLGAMLQAAEVARRGVNDRAIVLKNLDRIDRGADRIKHIVDDLLDMTRARIGGVPIAVQPTDLAVVVRDVVEELEPAAATLGKKITVSVNGNTSGIWDRHRVAQCVSNLVGNALKHSPPSSPVNVTVAGEEAAIAIAVHNEGTIEGKTLDEIFDPFRAGRPATQRSDGLGLGLYIAKAIARAQDGGIDVASTVQSGTTFTLRLPRSIPASSG